MIFERYEIEEILKCVDGKTSLKNKLTEVLLTTKDGRFTIHKTDRCKVNDVKEIGDLLWEEGREVRI